jgi:hypothetical protein
MTTEQIIPTLEKLLFAEEGLRVYAVLDGASMPNLLGSLYTHEPEFVCLYRGELEPDMAEVAPYLVWLDPDTDFPWWLLAKGWGKHWGVLVQSRADIRTLRRHFRTFLIVYDSTGKPMYFRWYDPRVLPVYLPTCSEEELARMFGPIDAYVIETEGATKVLRLRNAAGTLQTEKLSLLSPGSSEGR